MLSRKQFSVVLGSAFFVFQLGTVSCNALNQNRSFDSGQPHDLINQPACWSPEQPDDSRYCDFAQRI
jgi:hypothetical protein